MKVIETREELEHLVDTTREAVLKEVGAIIWGRRLNYANVKIPAGYVAISLEDIAALEHGKLPGVKHD